MITGSIFATGVTSPSLPIENSTFSNIELLTSGGNLYANSHLLTPLFSSLPAFSCTSLSIIVNTTPSAAYPISDAISL